MKPILRISVCLVIMMMTMFTNASTLKMEEADLYKGNDGIAIVPQMTPADGLGFDGSAINVKTLRVVSHWNFFGDGMNDPQKKSG